MADALERLFLDQDLRDNMGRAARERAVAIYHWDRAGERLKAIYQDINDRDADRDAGN